MLAVASYQPLTLGTRRETGKFFMKYAIIGSGKIGSALARVFARKNIEVAIANSRGPETLAYLAEELGPGIVPQSVEETHKAEIIFLAVPYSAHKNIAKQFKEWNSKIIVDTTNAFHAARENCKIASPLK